MSKAIAAVFGSVVALSGASLAVAASESMDWNEGVIVSANGEPRGSLDDRAIYSCARSMMHRMFPDAQQLRVRVDPNGGQVFGGTDDSTLPGVQMTVQLQASAPDTGQTLGSAVCIVSRDGSVKSLDPGTKSLPPM